MRLIDAEKLEKYKVDCCVSLTEWMEGWNDAIDIIMSETPTVDAEPVRHGHWESLYWAFDFYRCSKCGFEQRLEEFPYCPKCGTKMDGDK